MPDRIEVLSQLLRAFYCTVFLEREECSPVRPLVDRLNCNGFAMVRKPAKECFDGQGRRRMNRSMDIEIAVDAMELSPHVDHVALLAGDGDLRSPMKCLQPIEIFAGTSGDAPE